MSADRKTTSTTNNTFSHWKITVRLLTWTPGSSEGTVINIANEGMLNYAGEVGNGGDNQERLMGGRRWLILTLNIKFVQTVKNKNSRRIQRKEGIGKVQDVCLRGGNSWGVMRGMRLVVSDFLWTLQITHFRCLPLDAWNVASDQSEWRQLQIYPPCCQLASDVDVNIRCHPWLSYSATAVKEKSRSLHDTTR